ncbi:hypothetical protein PAXRUDRAFT_161823, partial [Paxillus rubicundulus Ve08.2h10]
EEPTKLFHEANILYWLKVLLNMTYNYIHHCISKAADPPPFDIPTLHFVDAGLVLAYGDRPNTSKGPGALKPGTVGTTYLAEELIKFNVSDNASDTGDNSGFIKFIHNGDPTPYPCPGDYGFETVDFLVFMQHVQYSNIGGQVYISDYQGKVSKE